MLRAIVLTSLMASLAGCQSQNPYAMFGPNRVPTPGTSAPAPYYPANVGTAPAATSTGGSGRVSISADTLTTPTSTAALTADPADKQPIRIVENPQPTVRTATTGSTRSAGSGAAPASTPQPAPASRKSSGINRTDANVAPASFEQAATPAAGQWKSR